MHIINILPHAQHYSYASIGKGGRTLAAGEHSPELLLSTIHNPQFLKDLESNKIQLRLSEEDIAFMDDMKKLSAEKEKKVKQAVKPPKPKPPKKKATPAKNAPPLPKKKLPPGQPDFGQGTEVIDKNKAGQVDLAALKGSNRVAEAQKAHPQNKVQEIQQFMGGRV